MKFTSVFLLTLAGSAMAKKNGTSSGTSTRSQCNQIQRLTSLVNLAANTTALDAKTKNNATKASAIKAKASEAATKLTTLESNATLVSVCNQLFAVEAAQENCAIINSLEKLVALAANTTALDSKTKNNATKASAIKAKASEAATKLTTLQSNTTLTQYCAVQSSLAKCNTIASLQKTVNQAANTTLLQSKFGSDSDKISSFQAKATKASEKLATLTSNTTLVNFCSASGTVVQAAAASASASATGKAKSAAAPNGNPLSMGAASALFAAVAATVFMI